MIAYKKIRSRKLFLILAFLLIDINSITNYIFSINNNALTNNSQNVYWLYDQASGKCISPFASLDECSELNLWLWKPTAKNFNLNNPEKNENKDNILNSYIDYLSSSVGSLFSRNKNLEDQGNKVEEGILVALSVANSNSLCLGRDRWRDR